MIKISIDRDGKITASGMIPGQVVMLTLADGACYRLTRLGSEYFCTLIDVEESKSFITRFIANEG